MTISTTIAGSNTSNNHDQAEGKLGRDFSAVVADTQTLLTDSLAASAQQIAGVPALVENQLGLVQSRLQRISCAIERQTRQATKATNTYVRENPWKTMGLVTAAGVALGYTLFSARSPAPKKLAQVAK